ncbi:hypothetical protein [Moraxella sp. VT-16-12]|uniref:hypothetical protein n=1 Tax=Moraxella sp. VT-16-12 TaxID=2014877 RepID=UPI000B80082A|nr:hypothetical protein [Moraxella sp. VT-16-12]TWV83521.1 hypothetical protein CEW93_003815 [Moraxella sp. VT-16-12]
MTCQNINFKSRIKSILKYNNLYLQIRISYSSQLFWKPYNNDKSNVNFAINNAFNENYRPHAQRAGETTLVGAGRDFRVGVNFTY